MEKSKIYSKVYSKEVNTIHKTLTSSSALNIKFKLIIKLYLENNNNKILKFQI